MTDISQYQLTVACLVILAQAGVYSVDPDIAIAQFSVPRPDGVTYWQDTATEITFDVNLANEAANETGDLLKTPNVATIELMLYLADNAQFEASTSDRLSQEVNPLEAGIRNGIPAGGSFRPGGGVRAHVNISAEVCGTHNYLCVRAKEAEGATYTEANDANNKLCILFGPQDDDKAGRKICQTSMDKDESYYGVVITLKEMSLLNQWPETVTKYRTTVAGLVNTYCNYNINFRSCCPGYGSKLLSKAEDIVTPDDVRVGRGYPQQSLGNLRVMTLVTPKESNKLCGLGSTQRSRRDAHIYTHYLSQRALLGALTDKEDDMIAELGYDVISIAATEHLKEEQEPLLESWLIAVIAICAVVSLAAIVAIIYLTLPVRKNRPMYIYG